MMLPTVTAIRSPTLSTQTRLRAVNAKLERAAHADRVHRMVVHTFTEFLNMMIIEKASQRQARR